MSGVDTISKHRTVQATATDKSLSRNRTLVIIAECAADQGYAERRADWESRVRNAKGDVVTLKVQGWRMPNGQLWPVNQSIFIDCPSCRVHDYYLIGTVEFCRSNDEGTYTQMTLKRPDAYLYKLDTPKADPHKKKGKKAKPANQMETQHAR
jgi:prophage tail gpP-like protein